MKRTVAALLAAAGICGLVSASAATTAGTGADPLVSQSYADSEVYESVTGAAVEKLEDKLGEAYSSRLDSAGIDGEGGVITALSTQRLVLEKGGSVEMRTGAEFTVLSGSAAVSPSGTVLDLSSAREITGTESLGVNVKYFAAEDTKATVTAQSDTIIYVSGRYRIISGVSSKHIYADVTDSAAWFYGDVYWAYDNKLFYGYEGDYFYPNNNTARAEMVYALWSGAGKPASVPADFSDVAADAWYAEAIGWAQTNGIINGYGDGKFGTDDKITREQICAIFRRYAAYLGRDVSARADLGIFSDESNISSWATEDIQWTVASGLIKGMDNGKMEPKGYTTRAQIAALLRRLFNQ